MFSFSSDDANPKNVVDKLTPILPSQTTTTVRQTMNIRYCRTRTLLGLAVLVQQPALTQAFAETIVGTILILLGDVYAGILNFFCWLPLIGWLLPYCNNYPNDSDRFDINLDFGVNISHEDVPFFASAAARWSEIITGDLPDAQVNPFWNLGFGEGCDPPGRVDDLYICAVANKIDGPGNVLAFATPYSIRPFSGFPATGGIGVDSDDLEFMRKSDIYLGTVLHEMGHVLGLGTLWVRKGLQTDEADCPYTGEHATAEFQAISGCPTLPTEQFGGAGRRCGHWSEICLDSELMTPIIGVSGTDPVSRITIGGLEDLGYEVNYDAADEYTVNDLNPSCVCNRRTLRDGQGGEATLVAPKIKPNQPRRKLNPELYDYAVQVGQQELQRRKEEKLGARLDGGGGGGGGNEDDLVYVGDKVISILVKEEDEDDGVRIWSVIVRADEDQSD